MSKSKSYMPHIDGVRAVAAFLVVFYHIFATHSPAGVDVFFVLSGFLIVGSVIRHVSNDGKGLLIFFTGLVLRLFPLAAIVLSLIFIGSLLFIPEAGHQIVLREIIASALYVENYLLAVQSVDYLDREEPPSPVMHFWALSMLAQFYLLSALIVWLVSKFGSESKLLVRRLWWIFVPIFFASLAYSVWQTYWVNQAWAYFDTIARFWEYLIGSLLALILLSNSKISLPATFGWLGLIGILGSGLIFTPSSIFLLPGYSALLPTLSTVLVILGGRSESKYSIRHLLGLPLFVSLGTVAYGIYLFHWPLLVFYREYVDDHVAFLPGMFIAFLSVVLAYISYYFFESWFIQHKKTAKETGRQSWELVIAALGSLIVVVCIATLYSYHLSRVASIDMTNNDEKYLGASMLTGDVDWKPDEVAIDVIPELTGIRNSLPRSYEDGCHIPTRRHDISEGFQWCQYGETVDYTKTIAIAGGSHSAQWLPAIEEIAINNKFRIIYSTWSGCQLYSEYNESRRCLDYAEQGLNALLEMSPDMVFTMASRRGLMTAPSPGHIEPWRQLTSKGIKVAALRDNPGFETAPARCLSRNIQDAMQCAVPRLDVLSQDFDVSNVPDGVHVFDFSNYYCNRDVCPAVIGSIVVLRDRHHFTVPFVLSLKKQLETELLKAIRSGDSIVNEVAVRHHLGLEH